MNNLNPTPAPSAGSTLGVLGHIAIHALAGAVRGLQAQQTRRLASDDAVTPAAADKPVATAAQAPAEPAASAKAEPIQSNPHGRSQPVDSRTLANAQLQYHALQNLKLAHAINEAKESDPHELQTLQAQAKSTHSPLLSRAGILGLTKLASGVKSYAEANEMGLAKKLAHGQIFPVPNPDGSVDVYELSPNAMYAPITKPIEIREPVGLSADGAVKWRVVGTVPPGGMTQAEAASQIVLPEMRAASAFVRARKENV